MPKTKILFFVISICLILTACTSQKQNLQIDAQLLDPHKRTYQEISRYSWPELQTEKAILAHQNSLIIPQIRNRLITLKDLKPYKVTNANFYDNTLINGVKRFQYRHGLNSDGIIGRSTLESLNVLPNRRLEQLKEAQTAWQELPATNENNEYIHVNLASYKLNIYKNKEKALQMKVVVGNPNWPTPTLQSSIETVVINPKWNIPKSITEREIIPKIAQDISYLEEENIKIIDGWHKGSKQIEPSTINWQEYATEEEDLPYRLVQSSGDDNALGKIKFTFPNSENVYLHDTPNKSAFKLNERNLSHGCVRLEKPKTLLNYLFETKHLNYEEKIHRQLTSGTKTKHYALKHTIPIYITRIKSWVDQQGLLHFRN